MYSWRQCVGSTVLRMPKDGVDMLVWQVTNKRPIMPMRELSETPVVLEATDWKLSGVVLPPPKAAA